MRAAYGEKRAPNATEQCGLDGFIVSYSFSKGERYAEYHDNTLAEDLPGCKRAQEVCGNARLKTWRPMTVATLGEPRTCSSQQIRWGFDLKLKRKMIERARQLAFRAQLLSANEFQRR